MEHKGRHWKVHEECIACTAVWQKAPLGLKRHQKAKKKKKIKRIALAIVELHLSEGISWSVWQSFWQLGSQSSS